MVSAISPSTTRPQFLPQTKKTTVSAWREVVVLKKNEKGELIKDKEGKPIEFSYIEDTTTGDLYNDDDAFTVAVKCVLIFLGTPLLVAGVMAWNAAKIFVDIARIAYRTLQEFGKVWKEKGCFEALKSSLKYLVSTTVKAIILQDLWHIVRAPIYGLGMQLTAIYGLFDPYNARKHIAMIENHWQDGISHEKDLREAPEKAPISVCPVLWKEEKGQVFYLAHCFQVQGNRNNSDNLFLKYKT